MNNESKACKILVTGGSGFIGRTLLEALVAPSSSNLWEVLNFDLVESCVKAPNLVNFTGDLLNQADLSCAFSEFQPEAVIHLAARVDCDESSTVEMGYRVNTDGTELLLEAVRACPSVQRLIVASSQYVCGPGRLPDSDEDYFPHTIYGESKVITEKLTRAAKLPCTWCIVRPTNVWGPWHARYGRQAWKVIDRGWYVHPTAKPVRRCYVYAGNLVADLLKILELPRDQVHAKTLYLTDPAEDIRVWVDAFSLALRGRPVRIFPFSVLKALALAGDLISKVTGKEFYLTSSRLRSMTTDYLVPEEPSRRILGPSPFSLEQGVAESVQWYRSQKGKAK